MWIILLDGSGSMSEPFNNAAVTIGRQRTSEKATKMEAAKESLLIHLDGLGAATEVTIFVFQETAQLIYEGLSSDGGQIAAALSAIEPRGNTNVGAALAAARQHADQTPQIAVIRVLLISDGLADAEQAELEARLLLKARIFVDVILIDPTEKGTDLSRRVVGGLGTVASVTSEPELQVAVGSASEAMAAESAVMETVRANVHRVTRQADATVGESLSFTAAYASEQRRDTWRTLLVLLHLASLAEEARNRALGRGRAIGADALSATVPASTRIRRGTELTLTPCLGGFDVVPQSVSVAWFEDIQSLEFRIRPTHAPEGPVTGHIEVAVTTLPIARIPISILARPAHDSPPTEPQSVSVGAVVETVFASHARSDAAVVSLCRDFYRSLGIELFVDKEALIGGQMWRPAIRALMAESQLFQLFWSPEASVSPPVADEIEDALLIQAERDTGYIRPMYWQNPAPPLPSILSHLNFRFLDLERIKDQLSGKAPVAPIRQDRDKPLGGHLAIPVAVLPLLPGTPARATQAIRCDVAFTVGFIESTLAERYFPVPTLLVDHHTVRGVRRTQTVDYGTLEVGALRELADWGKVIASICLAYHVREFWEGEDDRHSASRDSARQAGLQPSVSGAIFQMAEWTPNRWLIPAWMKQDDHCVPGLSDVGTLREAVALIVQSALAVSIDPKKGLENWCGNERNSWSCWKTELEALGLALPSPSSHYLTGTAEGFTAGLHLLWRFLEPQLAAVQDRFAERSAVETRLTAAADIAESICDEFLKGARLHCHLSSIVDCEIDPASGWQASRDRLVQEQGLSQIPATAPIFTPNQSFSEFSEAFFGSIILLLEQRSLGVGSRKFRDGYGIPIPTWKRLKQSGLADGLEAVEGYGNEVYMEGSIEAFITALSGSWDRIGSLLRRRAPATRSRFYVADVPTYGIFAPATATNVDAQLAKKANDWTLPQAIFLPNTDRVLLCADALDDFGAAATALDQGPNAARQFLRSLLVHEHFHAFAQTAPLPNGALPPGPGLQSQWAAAAPVNESIAAWMQLHFARDDADLLARVIEYINAGNYPEWPYAGALALEHAYQKHGIQEVRKLVGYLRTEPRLALTWMEQMMHDPGSVSGY